jgi:Ca-activated chloride channel family protein
MLQLKVFPVPPHGDQKVKLSYTSVAPRDSSLVEYLYPMKTDARAIRSREG